MSNFPALTPKELVKILIQKGFVLDRTKGSHQIWINQINQKRVIVPFHKKDLPLGTLFAILKQAGINKENL